MGDGTAGYDPDGYPLYRSLPVQVPGLTGVVAVAGGYGHSLALKSDGTVWAWGDNEYGQLGIGTTTDQLLPIQVSGLTGVTAVAAGSKHSMAVKSDGTVWTWGNNEYGQLGNGTTSFSQILPIQAPCLTDVEAMAAGAYHSLAIKSDGTVWAWGDNEYGQLGNGTTTDQTSPTQVSGLRGVVAVAAGCGHNLFITQALTVPPQLTGTWPANGTLERQVQSIIIGFDGPVLNVSADDLTLSAGTAVSVQGSGKGPYAFAVTDIPLGTTVTATIGGDIATADGVLLPPCQWTFRIAWPGDCNSDGYVNVGDLQLLVAAWSATPTAPNWDPAADLDHNNLVNVGDLWLLVANWAKSS